MTTSHDPETEAMLERLRRESDERRARMTPEQIERIRDRIIRETVEETPESQRQDVPPSPEPRQ